MKAFKFVILKLKGCASLWYETLKKNQVRKSKSKMKTWSKLKKHTEQRFLPSLYKQQLYLKITSLSQENLKVEEYIQELEQLQMRVGLNKDNELSIARFIKGLSPNIANKVELQTYISFNDVCYLVMKIEKQLKGIKPFSTPHLVDHKAPPRVSSPATRSTLTLHLSTPLTRVKGLLVSLLRG